MTAARPLRLVFVGGGRLAGLLYSTCQRGYEVLGYVDDVHSEAYLTTTYGVPCLGTSDALPGLKAEGVAAVVAITDSAARKKYGELLDSLDFPLATLVFPTAVVDEHAQVEPGCIIRHQAVIGPQVKLGRNCVVSDNAYVAHDSVVGAHTYISPGVNINGSVTIGEASFIGTGAVVIPERRIGNGCTVGAAACVTRDVADGQTVVGVPARPVAADSPAPTAGGGPAPAASATREPSDPPPLVSVLLSSYNHERFVGEAIRSALGQTLADLELIIIDDASTDGSVAVIEQFTDPRIRFVRHERNRGIGVTKNEAFNMARGTYVGVLNSDDAWLPDKLEKQVQVFADRPELGALFTAAQVIDENGEPFRETTHFYYSIFEQPNRSRPEWLNYFFHRGNCLCAPSALMPRQRLLEMGYLDRRLHQLCDMDLWVRICMRHPIWIHPERLTRFRVLESEGNASGRTIQAQVRGRWEYSRILRHYLDIPSEEELLAVFPEAAQFTSPGHPLDPAGIHYAVAQLALERPGWHRQLFALETLFELLGDQEAAASVEQRFGFGYKELTALAGRLDVFALTEPRSLWPSARRRLGRRLHGLRK
jgi:sugar O-acyltransferase (sialic acid O-acetyltransferase NeuD family)